MLFSKPQNKWIGVELVAGARCGSPEASSTMIVKVGSLDGLNLVECDKKKPPVKGGLRSRHVLEMINIQLLKAIICCVVTDH